MNGEAELPHVRVPPPPEQFEERFGPQSQAHGDFIPLIWPERNSIRHREFPYSHLPIIISRVATRMDRDPCCSGRSSSLWRCWFVASPAARPRRKTRSAPSAASKARRAGRATGPPARLGLTPRSFATRPSQPLKRRGSKSPSPTIRG